MSIGKFQHKDLQPLIKQQGNQMKSSQIIKYFLSHFFLTSLLAAGTTQAMAGSADSSPSNIREKVYIESNRQSAFTEQKKSQNHAPVRFIMKFSPTAYLIPVNNDFRVYRNTPNNNSTTTIFSFDRAYLRNIQFGLSTSSKYGIGVTLTGGVGRISDFHSFDRVHIC
jgi:hypothetical protein